jgi:hypothetical protein
MQSLSQIIQGLARKFQQWLQWRSAAMSLLKPISACCNMFLQLSLSSHALMCIYSVYDSNKLNEWLCALMT